MKKKLQLYSFFPGCSMATSARDNKQSLMEVMEKAGIRLVEVEDWSCCGSSSAHSINSELALSLASRNLFLAPANVPLVVACPSCNMRLKQAWLHLKKDQELREKYEEMWQMPFNEDLEILHLFEVLDRIDFAKNFREYKDRLKGLKFAPYYGCMLARPPEMNREKNYHGIMEHILSSLGAEPIVWGSISKCCGTFLSVTKPKAVTPIINNIIDDAVKSGAECLVTACSMCHLNLEIRCDLPKKIPCLHLTEILSVALGVSRNYEKWFAKHLVDPTPLLKSKNLII